MGLKMASQRGADLAEMGEKLSADDELQHEVERDVVLERGEQVDNKGVLRGVRSRI